MSLRSRVFLGLILVFELGLGGLVYHLVDDLERRYRESAEELLVDMAQLLAAVVAADSPQGSVRTDRLRQTLPQLLERRFEARIYEAVKREVNLRIYVTDRDGTVVYDSAGLDEGHNFLIWRDVRLTLAGEYGARVSRETGDEPGSTVMYVAAPLVFQDQVIGVVSVGKPTRSFEPFIASAKRNLIFAGVVSGLVVILLALAVALWLVHPYTLVSDYLRLIKSRRALDLPRLGRHTLGVLGAAFDEMRDALAGRDYVGEYVQALTHEIKSPLSAIRGAAELLNEPMPDAQRQRFLAHLREESGRIQDIVERLLELSALEKRRGLAERERIDLGAAVREAADGLTAQALAKAVTIHCPDGEGRCIDGERFLIHRALTNLLQNALAFSPRAGAVWVALSETRHHHEIVIRDQGPGIPDYAADRLFERFYSLPRPDTHKKSTGLGLSFVREIAELHRGEASLGNHPDGGAVARLRLPKA